MNTGSIRAICPDSSCLLSNNVWLIHMSLQETSIAIIYMMMMIGLYPFLLNQHNIFKRFLLVNYLFDSSSLIIYLRTLLTRILLLSPRDIDHIHRGK